MRYAIVSDLHANLQAWQTVLADITANQVDKIICLGDIVGYGPRPAEVLASAYQHVDRFVLGNHDAVIAGLMSAECFNDDAQAMIAWTRQQLDAKAPQFLRKVPLALSGEGFRCVHGSPIAPAEFGYIFDEEEAREAWDSYSEDILFIGHTHCPTLHYLNCEAAYRGLDPVDFEIEDGKRYIVNVGSVGMPRDDDFRASYVLYDSADRSVSFQRVVYDVESFRQDVRKRIGGTDQAGYVLDVFDEQSRGPIRERLDFSPGTARIAKVVVNEEQLSSLKARASFWRWGAAALLVLCLSLTAVAWQIRSQAPVAAELSGANVTGPSLARKETGRPISLLPEGEVYRENYPPPGWTYRLADRRKQAVSVTPETGLRIINNDGSSEVEIIFPRIQTAGRRKAQIIMLTDEMEKIEGETPVLCIDYHLQDGTVQENADSKSAVQLKDGVYRIQKTTRKLPKAVVAIQLRLRSRCQGTLRFKHCDIIPK